MHSFTIGKHSPRLFCSSWDFPSFPTASFGLSVDGRLMGAFHARAPRKEPAVPVGWGRRAGLDAVLTRTGNGSTVSRLCSARTCRPTDCAARLVLLSTLSKHWTVSTLQYYRIAASWHRPFSAPRTCPIAVVDALPQALRYGSHMFDQLRIFGNYGGLIAN